jgi:multiple sugar transport system substrate-binding protein
MMTRLRGIAQLSLTLLLVGCSSLAPFLSPPTPGAPPQATSTPQTIPTSTVTPTVDGPRVLRVWLPPRFDLQAGTPSADLLKARLQSFQDAHPDIQLEVRIKSEATILDAISVTSKAAPASMPDLIALTHWDMQAAVSAGFLHPLDGLTNLLDDPDWYAFARELGQVRNTNYGIPFAGDILLTVYRPSVFEIPPSSWDALFESGTYMVLPVSDPDSLFTLSLYLSENDQIVDDHSAVTLDEATLVRVLTWYKQAIESGTLLPQTKDYQTDAQSLQHFRDGNADFAVIRASSDIQTRSGSYGPLPGLNNDPYSIGDGWVWALAGSDLENQPLASELASHLADSAFMSEWTLSSGYLPTRPQALDGWQDEDLKTSIGEALQFAHPIPSDEVLSVVSPILQEALMRIFNGEQPEAVAQSVIEELE